MPLNEAGPSPEPEPRTRTTIYWNVRGRATGKGCGGKVDGERREKREENDVTKDLQSLIEKENEMRSNGRKSVRTQVVSGSRFKSVNRDLNIRALEMEWQWMDM